VDNKRRLLAELRDKYALRSKKGGNLRDTFYSIAFCEQMLRKNCEELLNSIALFQDNVNFNGLSSLELHVGSSPDSARNKKVRNILGATEEIWRLLQNYLSNTYSLAEHTVKLKRLIHRSKVDPSFDREYFSKLNRLQHERCYRFIGDLRTFCQHFYSLGRGMRCHFDTDGNVIGIELELSKLDLIRWTEWGPEARSYIKAKDPIILKDLIERYQALIRNFYEWFIPRVEKLFSSEFEEVQKIDFEIVILTQTLIKDFGIGIDWVVSGDLRTGVDYT